LLLAAAHIDRMTGQDGAVSSMSKGSTCVEKRIVHWLDDDTMVELDVPEVIGPPNLLPVCSGVATSSGSESSAVQTEIAEGWGA
jgi:hypothetical protein